MITSNSNKVKLNAVGVYIPQDRESNLSIRNKFGLSESFIRDKVGFINRSIKKDNETTSSLCIKAFEELSSGIKIDKNDISLLIVVTQNPDQKIPHTAAIIHNILELSSECMTFDISQACSGFVHGLAVAKALLQLKGYGKALLFTADPYSKIVNPDSKSEAILFGDASTASLISFEEIGYSIEESYFGTAPNSNDCIVCKDDKLEMNGSKVFHHVMDYVIPSIQSIINDSNLTPSSPIDLFLIHQGSKYVVDNIRNFFGFDVKVMPFLSENYGNTVSSSIPIMIKDIFFEKKYKKILISGFGVGFTWGHCLLHK